MGVALLDIQSYDQLCGKLETLFIKRLLWEDCLRCSDLCVWRNQRTFVRFQTSISCLCPEKKAEERSCMIKHTLTTFHWVFPFTMSAVSFSLLVFAPNIKESLQIFYTSPREMSAGYVFCFTAVLWERLTITFSIIRKAAQYLCARKKKIQYLCTARYRHYEWRL